MKVRWIAAARQDRADIIDYIAVENPRAALKIDDLFSEAAKRLGGVLPRFHGHLQEGRSRP
ncbi:hypothetical protein XACJK48_9360007 [Xanthomonas citri pv. citri]|nr:hypothetical protein XAC2911_1350001 [Xanthomonas citri pv. citri]CEE29080.1 hypothetical protein XAC902_1850014 [Xanthomonas citri pv. citri]CEH60721.1 hypothetical protein XACJK48_9360007 [Xanthomonas citri pv. citri]CEL49466.1 hypothetical protein XACJM35_2520001 [Xanthomonas citri pv. citri]